MIWKKRRKSFRLLAAVQVLVRSSDYAKTKYVVVIIYLDFTSLTLRSQPAEDTSDAYYTHLYKRYEVFERRQRIREKEKLQFERYKMRSRIDLLRNMSTHSWAVVVSAVLSRDEEWTSGRGKLRKVGVGWLRDRLVGEGLEVLRRYDQLLPVEKKCVQVLDCGMELR